MMRIISIFAKHFLLGLALLAISSPARAVEHTKGQGEPYGLAGKRLVFTNWVFVRTGQLDWADAEGNSIFQSGKVKAGPWDANFRTFFAPHGVRLVADPAQRLDRPIIAIEKPWEAMGISVRTLL